MAKFPALPLFTDAYLADTRHLTTLQHGAYLLLLMTAWRSPDCSLPNDDRLLARYAGLDLRTWKNNRDVVMSFWRVDGQKFRQDRLDDERNHAEHKRSVNSANGKASALKNKNRHSTTVQRQVNQNSTNPIPTQSRELKEGFNSLHHDADAQGEIPDIKTEKQVFDELFEDFWAIYPKNNGSKKRAREKYHNLLKGKTDHAIICEGAGRYARYAESAHDNPADRIRFTQHAATWLNADGWVTEWATGAGNAGGASGSQPGSRKKSPHDVMQNAWVNAAKRNSEPS